jgi:hypothetical protein
MTKQVEACCSSPAALCYWFIISLIAWGVLSFIGIYWRPLHPPSAAACLFAMAIGCLANWFRNRSFHCAIRSRTTLFYSQEVEDGCWWLPALRRGTNCFGAPAFRPSEFVTVLDETIEEIRSSMCVEAETQPAIASRHSGSIIAIPFSRRVSLSAIPVSAQKRVKAA